MTEPEFIRQVTHTIFDLLNGDRRVKPRSFPQGGIDSVNENELRRLNQAVNCLIEKFNDADTFVLNLSKGVLDAPVPPTNQLISPFEELQSNLRHLVWQTHRIAEGDYCQRIDFLGDFSDSFNTLISSLREKQYLEEQLKATAVELGELNATKDKLFSIIAHDLRNPFNAIISLSDFIEEHIRKGENEEALRMLELLQKSSQSTYNLLQNLLEWSMLKREAMQCNPTELELLPLVEDEVNTFRNIAQQKDIVVEINIPAGLMVHADGNMLKTVLRNLCGNALKYTHPGGKISISACRKGSVITIAVQDSGIGMTPEEIEKLFLLQSGSSKPGTRQEKGSGLGLMLCSEFIHLHNGTIRVESTPGEGSTFIVSIPG